jgi:hypothetical protein
MKKMTPLTTKAQTLDLEYPSARPRSCPIVIWPLPLPSDAVDGEQGFLE